MTPITDACEAVRRLKGLRTRSLDLRETVQHLHNILEIYQFRLIYQTFFPSEFNRSTGDPYPTNDHSSGHSTMELEVLDLIDQHLFPIGDFALELAHEREERLRGLMLIPYGSGWACSDVSIDESLSVGWQLLLPLCLPGRNYLDAFGSHGNEWYNEQFNVSLESLCHPEQIDPLRFHCYARRSPTLKYLPLATKILGYCTGNVWIDEDPAYSEYEFESATCFRWSVQNVRSLHRHWKQVAVIYDKVQPLITWLEADLAPRSILILDFWNQCKRSLL
jgi:hypothetical protein